MFQKIIKKSGSLNVSHPQRPPRSIGRIEWLSLCGLLDGGALTKKFRDSALNNSYVFQPQISQCRYTSTVADKELKALKWDDPVTEHAIYPAKQ
jgi:hypothetical protein